MQMSNDVKWNKIKQIEKILRNDINYDSIDIYLQQGIYSDSEAIKLADCDIWILANKFYDIATEGLYIEPDKYNWIEQPEHWCDIVDRVNGLPKYNNHPVIAYPFRDSYWEQYDYANS